MRQLLRPGGSGGQAGHRRCCDLGRGGGLASACLVFAVTAVLTQRRDPHGTSASVARQAVRAGRRRGAAGRQGSPPPALPGPHTAPRAAAPAGGRARGCPSRRRLRAECACARRGQGRGPAAGAGGARRAAGEGQLRGGRRRGTPMLAPPGRGQRFQGEARPGPRPRRGGAGGGARPGLGGARRPRPHRPVLSRWAAAERRLPAGTAGRPRPAPAARGPPAAVGGGAGRRAVSCRRRAGRARSPPGPRGGGAGRPQIAALPPARGLRAGPIGLSARVRGWAAGSGGMEAAGRARRGEGSGPGRLRRVCVRRVSCSRCHGRIAKRGAAGSFSLEREMIFQWCLADLPYWRLPLHLQGRGYVMTVKSRYQCSGYL